MSSHAIACEGPPGFCLEGQRLRRKRCNSGLHLSDCALSFSSQQCRSESPVSLRNRCTSYPSVCSLAVQLYRGCQGQEGSCRVTPGSETPRFLFSKPRWKYSQYRGGSSSWWFMYLLTRTESIQHASNAVTDTLWVLDEKLVLGAIESVTILSFWAMHG